MTYQLQLKRHLAAYRLSELSLAESGTFTYRGRELSCEHVLPIAHAWRNLLPAALGPARDFLAANPRKRHRYFHHLNSSQAFAFNLFFPYFGGSPRAATTLLEALGQGGVLERWEPEAVPDPTEGTNLDAAWLTTDGTETLCEVKLSEAELGKAVADCHHRRKLENLYGPDLRDVVEPDMLEPARFFGAYQFLRNVWHMVRTPNSKLIFLTPRANTSVWRSLEQLIPRVREPWRDSIRRLAIEDVLGSLCSSSGDCGLEAHATALARKYLPSTDG